MSPIMSENRAQAEAFSRMNGNVLELIQSYAMDFRQIIVEYEDAHSGQPPTAADLLWIESQHLGRDITHP